MTTFKIEKDLITYFKNFNTLQDAETYTLEVLGIGWDVTVSEEQITPLTPQQQLESDIFFGKNMIQQFLIDNRELGSIPVSDQLTQLDKFKDINTYCTNFSLELQDCVVKCKSNLDWKDQKECWKKCALE
jgi:hypothetical protein